MVEISKAISETKDFLKTYFFKQKLAKNTLYITTLRVIQILVQLASTYFIVRALNTDQYGEYQFILSMIGLFSVFSLTGLQNATVQSTARGFKGTFLKATPVAFTISILGSIGLLGMSAFYYFIQGNIALSIGFLVSAFFFPFFHGLKLWRNVLTGSENFKDHFLFNSAASILTGLSLIIASILFPSSVMWLILAYLLIPCVQNIYLTFFTKSKIPTDSPVENGIISYGIKTSLYSSVTIIANYIERILLFILVAPTSLALFAAASRIADIFQNMTQDLSVALAPKFSKQSNYCSKLNRFITIYSLIFAAIVLSFAFVILPPLMMLLFGEAYINAIPYSQALLFSVCLGNMATIQFRFIRSQMDEKSHKSVIFFTSFFRIGSALTLIPFFGISGAIASFFIYKISLSYIVHNKIKKYDNNKINEE